MKVHLLRFFVIPSKLRSLVVAQSNIGHILPKSKTVRRNDIFCGFVKDKKQVDETVPDGDLMVEWIQQYTAVISG